MKKLLIILFSIVICVVVYISYNYRMYTYDKKQINLYNSEFEKFCDKEITGTELATVINMAIDSNEKMKVQKDEKEEYISDDENAIKIEVYFEDVKQTYSMETINKVGVEDFVNGFNTEIFKSTKKEYSKNNKLKYILFEQQI